jgi:hypothetical protein
MARGDWNISAGRLQGDGSVDILESDLPLTIGSIDRNLSAPSVMTGSIDNQVLRLKVDGRPIFEPWNTVIIAEADDLIRALTIYRRPTFNGAKWELDQIGYGGYPIGVPYDGEMSYINADPLDIYREVWHHLQDRPGGDLGVTIDPLSSPVRVGTPTVDGDSDSGPRKLSWWDTTDLGRVVDDYAMETPFDWLETVYWDVDQPHCHIRLGHPTISARRDDLRLVLGENLASTPSFTTTEYVNQVYVLGAGEGRTRVHGYAGIADGRIRRARMVEDNSIPDNARAAARAADELNAYRGQFVIDRVDVYDHPNARREAIEPGLEIPLYAETDWATIDQFVRVVGKSESPQKSDVATLTVMRSVQS